MALVGVDGGMEAMMETYFPFSGKVVQGCQALDGPRESRGDGGIVWNWGEGSK